MFVYKRDLFQGAVTLMWCPNKLEVIWSAEQTTATLVEGHLIATLTETKTGVLKSSPIGPK